MQICTGAINCALTIACAVYTIEKEVNQLMVTIGNAWDTVLADEFAGEEYRKIRYFLKKEYEKYTIYPPQEDIFNAQIGRAHV